MPLGSLHLQSAAILTLGKNVNILLTSQSLIGSASECDGPAVRAPIQEKGL
jgi:hypothetical protein